MSNPNNLSATELENLYNIVANSVKGAPGIAGCAVSLSKEEQENLEKLKTPIDIQSTDTNQSKQVSPVITVDKNKTATIKEEWLEFPQIDIKSYTKDQIKPSSIIVKVLDCSNPEDVITLNDILNKQQSGLINISSSEKQFSQLTGNWKFLIIYSKLLFKKIL